MKLTCEEAVQQFQAAGLKQRVTGPFGCKVKGATQLARACQ